MDPRQVSGLEHLLDCLETLHGICEQMIGDPEQAIDSIRRRGRLAPPVPRFPKAADFESREAAAEARIQTLRKLEARRAALQGATGVVKEIIQEIAADPFPRRLRTS